MDVSRVWAVFTYKSLVHAIAGGLGNAFGIVVCYPLEVARTRLQVDDQAKAKYSLGVIRDIFQEEGITGLYRGLTSLALTMFCGHFVYFFVFHGLKAVLDENKLEQAILTDLVFGSIAGCALVIVTNPLWVINTRLKLQGAKLKTDSYKDLKHPLYHGIYDCVLKIIKYDGVMELWSGTLPSLMLVSNPAIQFMLYELLKRTTQAYLLTKVLSGYLYFSFGAFSKMVATLVTYPLQLVQTRVRAGYSGKSVVAADGLEFGVKAIKVLYRGLETKLSQTMLTAAVTLLTYELIAEAVFTVFGLTRASSGTSH